jgi:murein DD-endopeptidase MepM/ murein hydrolase activator NlpD
MLVRPLLRQRSVRFGVVVALLAGSAHSIRPAVAGGRQLDDRVGAVRYLTPPAGYYRPVVVGGKSFPVARSNFYGLVEFPNDWHEPRMRVVNGKWELVGVHEGIDITAERGTPVLSMTAGVVERVGWTFYCGTRIGIRGIDGYYYLYCHLDAVATGVTAGARVSAGSYLGRVGNTGYGREGHRDEFPPHLHFGIRAPNDGPWMNPYFTLLSLYSATVQVDQRTESALERLATKGSRPAWERAVERAFMGLRPWLGE